MDVQATLDAIDAALDDDDSERAAQLASDALQQHPDDVDLLAAWGDALVYLGDIADARDAYAAAVERAPESAEFRHALARCHFLLTDFDAALEAARIAHAQSELPENCDLLCRLAERTGNFKEADRWAARAAALDPEAFPKPPRLSPGEFRNVVREALDAIPERFRDALDEVAVTVEPVPPLEVLRAETPPLQPDLLGLYVGTPLTERESSLGGAQLPDRVYLFQHNLEHEASTPEALVEQIGITVCHELGHFFGFTDEELDERDFG